MPASQAPFMEFAISSEEDGTRHAINADLQVTVLPDADSYVCHERTKQILTTNPGPSTSILKCRLDDVWVYILGSHIVITKQKLHIEDLT